MIIFAHIPKTGGTTLFRALSNGGADVRRSHDPAYRLKPTYLDWETTFRFTLVRNPWDRAVSWYYWQNISLSFNDWIRGGCKHDPSLGVNPLDQLQYFTDPETGEDLVNSIGMFEGLQFYVDFLVKKLGIKTVSLNHYQPSCRPAVPYQELYESDTPEILADNTRAFIERFNYDFD